MTPNDDRGVVTAEEVRRLMAEGMSADELMSALLPRAAQRALPPISNFFVGAVARGTSGALYYGANLEFPGAGLGASVHAEQSAFVNAWTHGESGIERIAVTAAPCGHCRQFLTEISPRIEISMGSEAVLEELLPHAFGPLSLGSAETLMKGGIQTITTSESGELADAARDAACRSYAPYSRSWAGVAIRCASGGIYAAPYAENAAFNPSLPPLQGALALAALAGEPLELREAVLVCIDDLHVAATEMLLRTLGFAGLKVIRARNSA
jgi:cytidine deaminase